MPRFFDGLDSVAIVVTSILILLVMMFMVASFYEYKIIPFGGMLFFWVFDFWLTLIVDMTVIITHAKAIMEADKV